jgi:hypothetical protein
MEFSKNLAYMYQMFGLQQALVPNDNSCPDCPSGLKKTKFV